eukprot:scaffold127988_cov30-Tisochrysis_lutea.AAC.5
MERINAFPSTERAHDRITCSGNGAAGGSEPLRRLMTPNVALMSCEARMRLEAGVLTGFAGAARAVVLNVCHRMLAASGRVAAGVPVSAATWPALAVSDSGRRRMVMSPRCAAMGNAELSSSGRVKDHSSLTLDKFWAVKKSLRRMRRSCESPPTRMSAPGSPTSATLIQVDQPVEPDAPATDLK